MAGINPFYWNLWAQSRRSELAESGVGMYEEQVWYLPPRGGDAWKAAEDDYEPALPEDWEVVKDIENAIAKLRRYRWVWVIALEICEGAYINAHPDPSVRFRENRVSPGKCRKLARRAKDFVEREMYRQ